MVGFSILIGPLQWSLCSANGCWQQANAAKHRGTFAVTASTQLPLCIHMEWIWYLFTCAPLPTDYTMEDWAIEKTKSGARWTWSSLRPPYIIGVNVGSAMNILANIAVYGVFCKVGVCCRSNVQFKSAGPGGPEIVSNILQCQDGLHGESKRATRSQHCLFKGCLLGMGGVGVCCLLVGQGMQAACQGSIVASLRQGNQLSDTSQQMQFVTLSRACSSNSDNGLRWLCITLEQH